MGRSFHSFNAIVIWYNANWKVVVKVSNVLMIILNHISEQSLFACDSGAHERYHTVASNENVDMI